MRVEKIGMEGPDTMVEKIGNRQRGGGPRRGAPSRRGDQADPVTIDPAQP